MSNSQNDTLKDQTWKSSLTCNADMNYVSAVYGVVVLIILIDWFMRGKKGYRGQTLRHEEAGARLTGHEIVR